MPITHADGTRMPPRPGIILPKICRTDKNVHPIYAYDDEEMLEVALGDWEPNPSPVPMNTSVSNRNLIIVEINREKNT